MKTLVITLQNKEIVATIFEHENNDDFAEKNIIENCKGANIITKINIDGFSYVQYRKCKISPA